MSILVIEPWACSCKFISQWNSHTCDREEDMISRKTEIASRLMRLFGSIRHKYGTPLLSHYCPNNILFYCRSWCATSSQIYDRLITWHSLKKTRPRRERTAYKRWLNLKPTCTRVHTWFLRKQHKTSYFLLWCDVKLYKRTATSFQMGQIVHYCGLNVKFFGMLWVFLFI